MRILPGFISNAFNAVAPAPAFKIPGSSLRVSSGAHVGGRLPPDSTRITTTATESKVATQDPFIAKYGPLIGAGLSPSGVWRCTRLAIVTPQIHTLVWERAETTGGPIFTEATIERLKSLDTDWRRLDATIAEHGMLAAGRKALDLQARMITDLRAGKPPELSPQLDKNNIQPLLATVRSAARAAQSQISTEVFGMISPACHRLAEAARALCVIYADRARADSESLGFKYNPTPAVIALAYLAIVGCVEPLERYSLGVAGLSPDSTFFGRKLWTVELTTEQRQAVETREKSLEAQDALIHDKQTQGQRDADDQRTETAREHKAEVDKLNELRGPIIAELTANIQTTRRANYLARKKTEEGT